MYFWGNLWGRLRKFGLALPCCSTWRKGDCSSSKLLLLSQLTDDLLRRTIGDKDKAEVGLSVNRLTMCGSLESGSLLM